MKRVLFVAYGSGHIRMVLPVARALREQGRAQVQVLGLTTAAPLVREAGLPLLQIKDFVMPGDEAALARGRELVAQMDASAIDPQESAAYLGLCYQELEQDVGAAQAAQRYARDARQAFLPQRLMRRVLERVGPDLLVATNSPRAERGAIMAAGDLGIPSLCMVDLFALDEVKWIGVPGYAERVCVLNESVRAFLIAAGRQPQEIVVTGNPAFDALSDPGHVHAGQRLRHERGWDGRRVLLWPTQVEPAFHPFDGRPGDPTLPARALASVVEWVLARPDTVLCVRPRAGEAPPALPAHPRIVVTGQDIALPALLHAVDLVVTLNSTVGLEGRLTGTRLVQVLGSVFDQAAPYARYGIADEAAAVAGIAGALDRWSGEPRVAAPQAGQATGRVLDVLYGLL
ncbi:MAG: UDP-glycosyltransferase [Burkholderiaceae bacterium]|nr:UDP-glycosyltransferase [Burkholderiaceae bacterium]